MPVLKLERTTAARTSCASVEFQGGTKSQIGSSRECMKVRRSQGQCGSEAGRKQTSEEGKLAML
jgi:hypothetical protein